jgi:hypothetical protein
MNDETENPTKNELITTKPKTGTALSTDLQDELAHLKAFADTARSRRPSSSRILDDDMPF